MISLVQQHPWWFGFMDGALFVWIVTAFIYLFGAFLRALGEK